MGKVAPHAVEAELLRENPSLPAMRLRLYADALRLYLEASDNVRRLGAVVSHPRTGAPIENPFLSVQSRQAGILAKFSNVKASRAIAAYQAELAERARHLASSS